MEMDIANTLQTSNYIFIISIVLIRFPINLHHWPKSIPDEYIRLSCELIFCTFLTAISKAKLNIIADKESPWLKSSETLF